MKHGRLLDCTLRDGAYLVDKQFGDNTIKGIINGLVGTKIDFIEIGFFQDEGFGKGKTVFKNSEDARRFIPQDKKGCEFTVLADYSRFSVSNLDECIPESIDAVRECFLKNERLDAMQACKVIKQKGYKLFVQPVDILGYTDIEIIELIELVNQLEPFCFSIVDTFGSMYIEDLQRVFNLIDHNLISTCRIGFHSHNNMQMSAALSQEFLRMTVGRREVIIDATISGMGRGAGNTPIELMVQYMVSRLGYNYNIDALLDTIDGYMDNIRSRCEWGYSTPYFVAGSYSAHVNNIAYLLSKNSIRSKDIRYILNKVGVNARKRYDYSLLEKTYMDYLNSDIDDTNAIKTLEDYFLNEEVLIIAPGNSINKEIGKIEKYIEKKKPKIITINYLNENIKEDFLYLSNISRYNYWKNSENFTKTKKIIVSNVTTEEDDNTLVVSFARIIKCGWEYMDNSMILLLRLLDELKIRKISIAGFDGYGFGQIDAQNYADKEMELHNVRLNPDDLNRDICSMLEDYKVTRKNKVPIEFITTSRFAQLLEQ